MPKISEIKVSYRRSIQPKQFESAEASVLLTLLFDEKEAPDADEAISNALDKVINHVEGRITDIKPPAKANPTKPATAKPATNAKSAPASTPATGKKASAPGPTAPTSASPSKPKPPVPGAKKPAAPGSKPKPPAPGKAPKPAAPAAAAEPEQGAIVFTKGDAMAAIGATMTRLAAAGKTDGADLIDKIILGYLPDDKPPFSYNRIPEDSLGDFISDLKKLEA